MIPRDELEQRLWELIYDLLPEGEAEQLTARIRSEPDVARMYAEVKLRTDQVARAARVESPPLPFAAQLRQQTASLSLENMSGESPFAEPIAPADISHTVMRDGSQVLDGRQVRHGGVRSGGSARRGFIRVANWFTGVAAVALLFLNGYAYWGTSSRGDSFWSRSAPEARSVPANRPDTGNYQLATQDRRNVQAYSTAKSNAAEPVVVAMVAPTKVYRNQGQSITLTTSNHAGQPRAASLNFAWFDDQNSLLYEDRVATNERGQAGISVPTEQLGKFGRLRVHELGVPETSPVETVLTVQPTQLVSHLTTDRPTYRPGDTVLYRSVTLSRASLDVERDVPVRFAIQDPDGNLVEGGTANATTQRGVAHGAFVLPTQSPSGEYVLAVSSETQEFVEQRRRFQVWNAATARTRTSLEWERSRYAPGEVAAAHLRALQLTGEPLAGATIQARAIAAGETFFESEEIADNDGGAVIQFALPDGLKGDDAHLVLAVEKDGLLDSITKSIPVGGKHFDIDFLAESGRFVPGIPNQVYLLAHDATGKPVQVAGEVIDTSTNAATEFSTVHQGMGRLELTPSVESRYIVRLQIPADAVCVPRFPELDAVDSVALRIDKGVLAAGAPIELLVRNPVQPRKLVVFATCRGTVVGQTLFEAPASPEGTMVQLPLAEDAAGVIRVTAADASQPSPNALAERLVYRRPLKKLTASLERRPESFLVGKSVSLRFRVRDESGAPAPAVLGVSLVDETEVARESEPSNSLVARFLLTGNLDHPRRIEDADFYLNEEAEAEEALELLLGTYGWRRLSPAPPDLSTKLAAGRLGSSVELTESMDDYVRILDNEGPIAFAAPLPALASTDAGPDEATVPRDAKGLRDTGGPQGAGGLQGVGELYEIPATAAPPSRRIFQETRPTVWLTTKRASLLTMILGGVLFVVGLSLFGVADQHRLRSAGPALAVGALCLVGGLVSDTGKVATSSTAVASKEMPSDHAARFANESLADQSTPNQPLASPAMGGESDAPSPLAAEPAGFGGGGSPTVTAGAAGAKSEISKVERSGLEAVPAEAVPAESVNAPLPSADPESRAKSRVDDAPKMAFKPADPSARARRTAGTGAELKSRADDAIKYADRKQVQDELESKEILKRKEQPLSSRSGVASESRDKSPPLSRAVQAPPAPSAPSPPPAPSRSMSAGAASDSKPVPPPAPKGVASTARSLDLKKDSAADSAKALGTVVAEKDAKQNLFFKREYFRFSEEKATGPNATTPAWEPLLIADDQGEVSISFELDRSVRAYRLRGDMHASGRLGVYEETLVAETPLYAEFHLPGVLTVGDEFELPVVIRNRDAEAAQAKLEWKFPASLKLAGDSESEFAIGPKSQATTAIRLRAEQAASRQPVTVRWDENPDGGSRTVDVQVRPLRVAQYVITSGDLPNQPECDFELPADWKAQEHAVSLRVVAEPNAQLQAEVRQRLAEPSLQTSPSDVASLRNRLNDVARESKVARPELLAELQLLEKRASGTDAKLDAAVTLDETLTRRLQESPRSLRSKASGRQLSVRLNNQNVPDAELRANDIFPQEFALDPNQLRPGRNQLAFVGPANTIAHYTILSTVPPPSDSVPLDVRTAVRWETTEAARGAVVPVAIELHNASGERLQRVISVVRIPAGLEVQFEQWEEFRKRGEIASYELRPGEIVIAWPAVDVERSGDRCLRLNATLLATTVGEFHAPGASTFVYSGGIRHEIVSPAYSISIR